MDIEKLQAWLNGKFVPSEEFKASVKAVVERVRWMEMTYENTGSIMNRRHQIDKIEKQQKQIERYEKALKEILETSYNTAKKALEE
jgi:hypothetical protein